MAPRPAPARLPCRSRRNAVSIAALVLAVAGSLALGQGAWLWAKAEVGQWLLERAWARVQGGEASAAPWPWADTQPVARLAAPAQGIDLIVLAGASARTLAWGPGHLAGSARPGDPGHVILTAHRDTHFRFLRTLPSATRWCWNRPVVRGGTTGCARSTRATSTTWRCRATPPSRR